MLSTGFGGGEFGLAEEGREAYAKARAMRCSLFAALLFCALPAGGEPVAPGGEARGRDPAPAVASAHRPWVWEARLGDSTIWLVGSIHLGLENDGTAYPSYLPYYQKAERVYFEIPPASMDTFEVRRIYTRRGYLKNHQSLESLLPEELWQEMRRTLDGKPDLLSRLAGMEPWLAALQLTHLNYERAGFDRGFGLEDFLSRQASRDRKAIGGLEMAKDQIVAFADSPVGEQNTFLRTALRGYAARDQTALAVRKAWMQGDDAELRRQLGVNLPRQDPTLHRNLIAGRNQKWVGKIREIAGKTKSALVVVGVEHLVGGEANLPALLEKQGFVVRRVGRN
jgi:uncharacterized protein YbaP (TraB family)